MLLSKFHDLLVACEATSSKNEKQALIAAGLKAEPGFKKLFELALSPYITFGIAQLPDAERKPCQDQPWAEGLAMSAFEKLASREITGNAARELIHCAQERLEDGSRAAFERILLKDLRAGFSESTVNKACPGTVPVFSCQLAVSELVKLNEIVFPCFVEPKLDGVRTIAVKKHGVVTLFSRNGKEFENFEEVRRTLQILMPDEFVLDGEVISTAGFAQLMTRAKAKAGKVIDVPIEYHVFDGMSLRDWEEQDCSFELRKRHEILDHMIGIPNTTMKRVRSVHCGNVAVVEDFYKECVNAGYEGIMVKQPDGPYTFKRNKTWRKLKPFDTIDLNVVGIVEGTGKYAGSLGALVCEGEHGGKKIRTEVGSGFTDQDRHDRWKQYRSTKWATLTGELDKPYEIIEVRYQEITQSKDTPDTWSLRFPSFVRSRGVSKL